MIYSIIVAYGKGNRVIGKDNSLLWRLSDDFKLFKSKTMGHCMLMGRKTYESIGKALPGRTTIVLSSTLELEEHENLKLARNLTEVESIAKECGETEVFICGGASLYNRFSPLATNLYLTEVECNLEGDTFLCDFELDQYELVEEQSFSSSEKNQYPFIFRHYAKK